MIGIVVVAHDRALARAAAAFAGDLAPRRAPRVEIAAGLDDTTLGTDAAAIAAAIESAAADAGVLVLVDLGSAVLSAEMALEFLDPGLAGRVRISPAPLVEGLVAAVVTAAGGADLDEVDRDARAALTAKQEHLAADAGPPRADPPDAAAPAAGSPLSRGDAPAEPLCRSEIRAPHPHGLHVRPAAALVAALAGIEARVTIVGETGRRANARSLSQLAALGATAGAPLVVEASGRQASAAVALVASLAGDNFGDAPTAAGAEPGTSSPSARAPDSAVGRIVRLAGPADLGGYVPGDPATEARRSARARAAVAHYLAGIAERQPVLAAQLALLDDPEITAAVAADLDAGHPAPAAWQRHLAAAAAGLDALPDAYLRERAQDVRSLARLIRSQLLNAVRPVPADPVAAVRAENEHAENGHAENGQDENDRAENESADRGILVLPELDAATAATLDPDRVAGVITTSGGGTGHGVLVARARGIPVLTGRREAADLPEGTRVAIDSARGDLVLDPTAEHLAELAEREHRRADRSAAELARAHEPALTRAGTRIRVEVNISALADAVRAAQFGADGIGVVRTELLFATAAAPPSAAEQAAHYAELARHVPGPTTIRTWDAGGDKPLPFLPQEPEANPFLGVRGIRSMRQAPGILAEQFHAIARTACRSEVRVLLPMVTDPEEVAWAAALLARARDAVPGCPPIPLGIMVEVPATALRIGDYAALVDFASIGTNDLAQYAFAADRANAAVSSLARQDHPAILDLVGRVCAGLPRIPVAVCGALAADPALTATLVALGVRELSVPPPAVPAVKAAVRACGQPEDEDEDAGDDDGDGVALCSKTR